MNLLIGAERKKKFLRGKSPANKRMRRGVSTALERLQRPGRLAKIAGSIGQAREQAAKRRDSYLKRNPTRAWRKAAGPDITEARSYPVFTRPDPPKQKRPSSPSIYSHSKIARQRAATLNRS